MNYGFIDFEFTCDGKVIDKDGKKIFKPKRQIQNAELISVGLVIMNSKFEVVKRYYKTVKPSHNPKLTDYCMLLTKLTQSEIDTSLDAVTVVSHVIDILNRFGIKVVYAYGDCDAPSLKSTCFWGKKAGLNPRKIYVLISYIKDISFELKNIFKSNQRLGIAKLCEILLLDNDNHFHNALYDAEMLGKIFKAVYDDTSEEHMKYLAYLNSDCAPSQGRIV